MDIVINMIPDSGKVINICIYISYTLDPWSKDFVAPWCTAQLHLTKLEFRFCAGSNPARSVSEICDGEDL